MLKLAYVGIAFSLVFYVVFGLAVRFMELSGRSRNKARLGILLTSMIVFAISGITAGVLNLKIGLMIYGVGFLLFSFVAVVVVFSIFVELHQINLRVRMRRFMVLFDIVDRFINEGKTRDEIFDYLTVSQKLSNREASPSSSSTTIKLGPLKCSLHHSLSSVNMKNTALGCCFLIILMAFL